MKTIHTLLFYPTADSITERNELVYAFPRDGFKLVIGPVERDDGLIVWRVERHPDSTTGEKPDIFPTFSAAFDRAKEYADARVASASD